MGGGDFPMSPSPAYAPEYNGNIWRNDWLDIIIISIAAPEIDHKTSLQYNSQVFFSRIFCKTFFVLFTLEYDLKKL